MPDLDGLVSALRAGHQQQAEDILTDDPSLAEARFEGASLPLLALYYGQRDMANWIADKKQELDFFEAAALGRVDRLGELVKEMANLIDSQSPDGFPPLCLAAYFGQKGAVTLLLEAGASVNVVSKNALNVAPLHSALAHNHGEIARLLIAAGANVNIGAQHNWTPLHYAAHNGDRETVLYLLQQDASKDAKQSDGRTPADVARDDGHQSLAELLS